MSTENASDNSIFPEKLRSYREMRGLTQGELGRRANMAAASVSHFETGQRAPSLDSLIKLADALEISTDVLLGRATIEQPLGVDPIFLRASRADSETLERVRRVTEALLSGTETK